MKPTLRQLIELAKESNITDPIDWTNLNVSEDTVYDMIGLSVMEMLDKIEGKDSDVIMAASILKLTVENFILNLRLQGKV
jgi:hypothetical protein|tara:strand:- start:2808 stop:3047 length:240 start_codon:yes stop_codon:yes gene_type:complete